LQAQNTLENSRKTQTIPILYPNTM